MKTVNEKLALKLLTYIAFFVFVIFLLIKLKVVIGYILIASVLALILRILAPFDLSIDVTFC